MLKKNSYLDYFFSLERKPIRLGLRNISILCSLLGEPQLEYKTIHVAGTNGKGSVTAMISSILKEAGFRVGMFTSPHLYEFNERIQVNGKKISEKELIKEIKKIKKLIEDYRKKSKRSKKFSPTFFEISTAIAFDFFKEKKTDYAVIETGMGGRLDATNVVHPEISVITNIGIEHQKHLGNTITKIASEKAGIIKENSIVVTAEEKKEALNEFRKKCREKKAKLLEAKKLCKYEGKVFNLRGQKFNATIKGKNYFNLEIPLLGGHQLINACTALLAVNSLKERIPEKAIRNGFKKTFWPARFEVKKTKPLLVLDAAHNPHCFNELRKTVIEAKKRFKLKKLILIIGLSKDKNLKEIASIIFPLADEIIISKSKHFKAMETNRIIKEAKKYYKEATIIPNISNALRHALNSASEKDFILVTGSIYLLGETKGKLPRKDI